ncbi:uncharacterized protein L201_005724 [Kwoniella dendrophila CBS 6074]|uniref:Gfo/Idh/MocA-like oxidoreductase N-terminal domain-containing protein n=1 Tax=Kwoniella dendrophila CBS 6074 TaxID=1295534 RepID=A0AAX4JZT4_9TREE
MTPNIALLGTGTFAKQSYLPALLDLQGVTLNVHSVWSRSEGTVKSFIDSIKDQIQDSKVNLTPKVESGDQGLNSILANKDIDAVLIVLPITSQPEIIRKCLKAGKHVLSEKPIAKDVKDAKALIDEYERDYKSKGLIWRIAENYSHEPLLREASELISSTPELGPILFWQLNMQGYIEDGSKYHKTSWRTIPDYQGGFLLDGGVHWTAFLRTVLPESARPSSIISVSSLHRTHLLPHDTIHAISLPSKTKSYTESHGPKTKLTTASNKETEIPGESIGKSYPTGQILLSFALPDLPKDKQSINGLKINFLNAQIEIQSIPSKRSYLLEITPAQGSNVEAIKKEGLMVGVNKEIELFTKAISNLKQNPNDIEKENDQNYNHGKPSDALWDLKVLQAMLQSNGKEVSVDDLV